MRHPIDPKVDCVFKALLGAEANRGLLIHFLNAVLGGDLPRPITSVRIMNPYGTLRPTYSIWLLGSSLIDADSAYAHNIRLRKRRAGPRKRGP